MGTCLSTADITLAPTPSNRIMPAVAFSYGVARLPTDALFYADLSLQNLVAGSRYRVTRAATGVELATGTVPGSGLVDHVITGVPCYANPMLTNILIRNASGATKYKSFETAAYIQKSGGSAYIIQQED